MYTIINVSEDGIHISSMPGPELKKKLEEDYWGSDLKFLTRIPGGDPQEWGRCTIIIKGDVIVPQPVQTVTEYKL